MYQPARFTVGLLALINAVGARKVDEQTIGFTIGPLLNAPGRLRDDGAMESLQLLITEDYAEAEAKAFALIETNNMRKDLLKKEWKEHMRFCIEKKKKM